MEDIADLLLAVISRLEITPDDLTLIPDPIVDDEDQFESALYRLPLLQSLYGASFAKARPSWGLRALEWSKQGPDNAAISAWISRALASGSWDTTPWFDGLRDQDNGRLREIFAHWGNIDLEVSPSRFGT